MPIDQRPPKQRSAPAILCAAATLLLAVVAPRAAAQESGQKWEFQGQAYNTQYEAELAIKAQGGAYQYVDSVRERQITETDVQLTYGIAPETGQVRTFSPDDRQLAESLASQAAISLTRLVKAWYRLAACLPDCVSGLASVSPGRLT